MVLCVRGGQPRSGDVRSHWSQDEPAYRFGVDIHRRIVSNLVGLEIAVALAEWLAAIPEFHLKRSVAMTWSHGTVRGPRRLPILFR
jgi:cytochrome P450